MISDADLQGIWSSIDSRLSELSDVPDLWEQLREKTDPAAFKPMRASGIVERRLKSNREGEYHILKNPRTSTYLKLTDRDLYLWNLMDGTRSISDLVVAYFLEYNSFALERVGSLVAQLRNSFFLTDQPVDTFHRLKNRLDSSTFEHKADVLWKSFLSKEFSLHNIDGYISKFYKAVGWVFFTKPLKILCILLSVLGAFFFTRQLNSGKYPILQIRDSYGLGFLTILIIYLVIVIVHELAHAFTAKSYGRDIRKGGFMIYFGMPAFFVDTMDMWMEPRRARMAVSWAGPYVQLIFGGVCSLVAAIFPETGMSHLLFKVAFFSYLSVFLNLNPLLELDGYFILMDWLEIPLLRRKSLEFVKRELWPKILRREEFSKDERVFSIFGILAGVWSMCAVGIAVYLWERRVTAILTDWFQKGLLHKLYLGALALALGVPLLVILVMRASSALYAVFLWVINNKHLKTNRNFVSLLVIISIGLAILCYSIPASWSQSYRDILKLTVLSFAMLFAMRDVAYYNKGHLDRTFQLLAAFVLFLFIADSTEFIGLWLYADASVGMLVAIFRIGAYGLLLLSMSTLAAKEFKLCRRSERIVTLAFLAACAFLLTMSARWLLQSQTWRADMLPILNFLFPMALVSVALVLLTPGYYVYQRTEFRTAWLVLAVSLAGMSIANAFRFYEKSDMATMVGIEATSIYVLSYSLLASALLSHYVIYKRVRFARTSTVREAVLRYDDRQRLRSAFTDIYEAVFSQFMSIHGRRVTRYVQDKLNTIAQEAGWKLKAVYEKIQDDVSDDFNIVSLGEIYRGFLSQMLEIVSGAAGKAFVREAVQRGWDQLYWEEREVADEYLFSPMNRGKELTKEFRRAKRIRTKALQEMTIFSGLSEEELSRISARLQIEKYKSGTEIVRQGDVGDKLYIIKSGEVEVSVRNDTDGMERIVERLSGGDHFGELALMGNIPRTATCRATTSVEVWMLGKEDFDQLVRSNLDLPEKLDLTMTAMILLKKMPIFREFKYKDLNTISSMLKSKLVPPRTTIIRQGEPGDAFYVIRSGEVVVSVKTETGEKPVGRLGEAEYFGEIALVSNQPRTATVTSMSETELLVLEKSDFDTVMELIGAELEQSGSRRLLDTRRKIRDVPATTE